MYKSKMIYLIILTLFIVGCGQDESQPLPPICPTASPSPSSTPSENECPYKHKHHESKDKQ